MWRRMSTLSLIKTHEMTVRHNSSDYEYVWYAEKYMPLAPPYTGKQVKLTARSTSLDSAVKNLSSKIRKYSK